MEEITLRELRRHGRKLIERVTSGEHLTVTRDGKPVATLSPHRPPPLSSHALVSRWATLPPMDPTSLRRDADAIFD